ncbi:hypothetical protein [Tissierella praeacuta]|nr:hypothetical protein [Tissierella praeacuta]
MTKKIDNSFNKLKKYIIDVGERKALQELDVLDYREFNDVGKTVQKMSSLVVEILFLSKMDMDHSKTNQEIIELKELIYDCSWR